MLAAAGERIQSLCGAGVDRTFLRLMEWMWGANNRQGAGGTTQPLDEALATYASGRLADDPLAFFPAPPVPAIEIVRSRPIRGGRVEKLRWRSGYRTWDRRYQEEFDGYTANQTAYAECVFADDARRPMV